MKRKVWVIPLIILLVMPIIFADFGYDETTEKFGYNTLVEKSWKLKGDLLMTDKNTLIDSDLNVTGTIYGNILNLTSNFTANSSYFSWDGIFLDWIFGDIYSQSEIEAKFDDLLTQNITNYEIFLQNGSNANLTHLIVDTIKGRSGPLKVGTGTPSRTTATNDLYVTEKFEVDGLSYFDGVGVHYAQVIFVDGIGHNYGSDSDVKLVWWPFDTHTLKFGLGDTSKSIVFVDKADIAYDQGHVNQLNPTIFVHSKNPTTTEWISITHDGTDGVIDVGTDNIKLNNSVEVVGNDFHIGTAEGGMSLMANYLGQNYAGFQSLRSGEDFQAFFLPADVDGTDSVGFVIVPFLDGGNNEVFNIAYDAHSSPPMFGIYPDQSGTGTLRDLYIGKTRNQLMIKANGNVGIHTSDPSTELEITGTTTTTNLSVTVDSTFQGQVNMSNINTASPSADSMYVCWKPTGELFLNETGCV